MMVSPGERVLEMVEAHRQEASLHERRGMDDTARLIRSLADDYERIVRKNLPDWIAIEQAQQRKGWSGRWWRQRCRELRGEGLARKRGGRWELHRSALDGIKRKPVTQDEVDVTGDVRELANQLAQD